MGDIRRETERAAALALKPRTETAGALAVAEQAVKQAPQIEHKAAEDAAAIMAKAKEDAAAILAKAKEDAAAVIADGVRTIEQRHDTWAQAWQAALEVGWTAKELTDPPMSLEQPHTVKRGGRRSGTRRTKAAARQEPVGVETPVTVFPSAGTG